MFKICKCKRKGSSPLISCYCFCRRCSNVSVSLCKLLMRDPDSFVPGGIRDCLQEWEKLDIPGKLRNWLKDGVDVQKIINLLKVVLKGNHIIQTSPL